MNLSSRTVLTSGQKPVEVFGPFPEIEDELMSPHRTFWSGENAGGGYMATVK
ncbi:hypothetical protein [Ensifer sp. SSB1]|jgi:hypothetical protein|uniref:hypothetical protein n=1 Tax=Ensifer sp. SSB1 TaxID=2795385 RepID=UPI0025C149BE|nr:hypothetical protein [Ensifer sp. SSB1]